MVGHRESHDVLAILAHDELESRLVLLERLSQLAVLLLELSDLCVLLHQAHDEVGAGPVARHVVQLIHVLLVLGETKLRLLLIIIVYFTLSTFIQIEMDT